MELQLLGYTLPDIVSYAWHRLPLILLFASGYLVYRLLAVTKLTDAFVRRALVNNGGGASRLLLLIMGSSALLSLFIPNAITMLTLLPVLGAVDRELSANHGRGAMTTAITLAAIYGANIGGMGSLIGSPANLMLIGALDYFQVPGREQISFVSWFVWSLPLVAVFLLLAWGVVRLAVPKRLRRDGIRLEAKGPRELTPWQRSGLALFVLFLLFWTGSSVARELWPAYVRLEPAVCAGFFAYFVFLAFFRGGPPCQGASCPLLRVRDVFTGLPLRGVGLLLALGAVALTARHFRLDEQAAGLFGYVSEIVASPTLFLLCMVLAVIFLTEALSNTLVAAAFLPLAYFASQEVGLPPLLPMLAVSIGSTCAFMTPIATPCNALAVGEMRGVRLPVMLGLGALLNVMGALLMAGWLAWVIPLVYGR